jgi:hypothetical protein
MKISVDLPDEDVAFLDDYVVQGGAPSRSSAIQQAIGLLQGVCPDVSCPAMEECGTGEDDVPWDMP